MYGYICPCCGDHLDPGEKCEQCEAKRKKQHRLFKNTITIYLNTWRN